RICLEGIDIVAIIREGERERDAPDQREREDGRMRIERGRVMPGESEVERREGRRER
ncbi:hypothetical protein Tco_0941231, partial [Tanacetum coccineum]